METALTVGLENSQIPEILESNRSELIGSTTEGSERAIGVKLDYIDPALPLVEFIIWKRVKILGVDGNRARAGKVDRVLFVSRMPQVSGVRIAVKRFSSIFSLRISASL